MTNQTNTPVNTADNAPTKILGAIARANLELPAREVPATRDPKDLKKALRKSRNAFETILLMNFSNNTPTADNGSEVSPNIHNTPFSRRNEYLAEIAKDLESMNVGLKSLNHQLEVYLGIDGASPSDHDITSGANCSLTSNTETVITKSKPFGVIAQANSALPEKEKTETRSLDDLSKALHKTSNAIESQLLVDLFIEAANTAIIPHLDMNYEQASYNYYMKPLIASATGFMIGMTYNESDICKVNLAYIKNFAKKYEKPPEFFSRDIGKTTDKPNPS